MKGTALVTVRGRWSIRCIRVCEESVYKGRVKGTGQAALQRKLSEASQWVKVLEAKPEDFNSQDPKMEVRTNFYRLTSQLHMGTVT